MNRESNSLETEQFPHSSVTWNEISHQADIWPITVESVQASAKQLNLGELLSGAKIVLTGAGTSAYAAAAIASAWPGVESVPTTDLLVDAERYLSGVRAVISLARSGDSPESSGVAELIRAIRPDILQIAILCNQDGALARSGIDALISLDPRTNDHSLVMTSSFSNLVMAGLTLAKPRDIAAVVPALSLRGKALLPAIDDACRQIVQRGMARMAVLASSPLQGWAREAVLKTLEMTAGKVAVLSETFLGLRHGPMSFIEPDTLVLCLLSSDPLRRAYEIDLIEELKDKKLGYLVGITEAAQSDLFDSVIPAVAPHVEDALRTPFEIMGPQLLGYYFSLRLGLNPDNPSPQGIINRVVQGFRIHTR